MSKTKTAFFCQHCGNQSPKWTGKCAACGEWNTLVEEVIQKETPGYRTSTTTSSKPTPVAQLEGQALPRITVHDEELSRVLGGGIVPGSIILFGGEPGIGKSTLMLQFVLQQKIKTLYVSGEESEEQIRMRVDRIKLDNPLCYVLMETSLESIFIHADELRPQVLIIDSIQTLSTGSIDSSPGSVSQVRECASQLQKFAKETGIAVFLVGHITKDGSIAGPKVLEHMVDCVLQFEGDRHHIYRLLRAIKNRFGSTNELGIYEMLGNGLRQVANPSELLIHTQTEHLSGSAIAASMEGLRPILVEIQALVSSAVYGTPQRSTTGYDIRRLNMLLAVLEKRCGFRLGVKDVFLNIAGGIRLEDPAMDLAVVASVLSSSEDIAVPHSGCFAGEVGLNGEIRPVTRIDQRINEAAKLGFKEIYVSKSSKGLAELESKIKIVQVEKVEELFSVLFG